MMFLVFAILVSALFVFRRSLYGVSQLPPGPYSWELLRNLPLFMKNPHIAMTNLAEVYGPLISFWVGDQFVVVASSPSTAKKILKSHLFTGRYFPAVFYNVPGSTNASIIMARECEGVWKSLRAIGKAHILSPRAVELNVANRSSKILEMTSYLRLRAKQGEVVNVDEAVLQSVVNIGSNVLASRNLIGFDIMGRVDEKFVGFLGKVTQQVSSIGVADMYPVLQYVDFWSKRGSMALLENIRHVWGDTIEERRLLNHHDDPKDLLDVLLADDNKYSNDQIAFSLTELLVAATESTTGIIIWLLIEFVKKEEILHRVRYEIETEAIEGGSLNESRLSSCTYFNACIKETLRRHNPGPLGIPRRAIETCRVDNYVVPKDSIVMVNFWAIHFDPKNYVDPMSFKPERFLSRKGHVRGIGYDYMPFSSGMRMCPGINVAIKNIQVIAATLVYFFDWSLPDGIKASDLGARVKYTTLVFKREDPLCLIPRERKRDMHIVNW